MQKKISEIVFHENSFGMAADLDEFWPDLEYNTVIYGVSGAGGLKLLGIRLPHQFYRDDLEKILAEHQASELYFYPVHSDQRMSVTQ